MSVASADIHKAIRRVWTLSDLSDDFTQYWSEIDRSEFTALNDWEASPSQPFPYCVFEQSEGTIVTRMSGHTKNERHEIRDVPWMFRIHARQVGTAVEESAKEIAASLAERIIEEYGGHPTETVEHLPVLDNGSILLLQYLSDVGIRTGEEEYKWQINYNVRVDVPVS